MGGMEWVERDVLVRQMYCSSVGLEDKGGIQSDLPLNKCLGGGGLFSKECLILRDRENLSKPDSRFLMLYILGLGMNHAFGENLFRVMM